MAHHHHILPQKELTQNNLLRTRTNRKAPHQSWQLKLGSVSRSDSKDLFQMSHLHHQFSLLQARSRQGQSLMVRGRHLHQSPAYCQGLMTKLSLNCLLHTMISSAKVKKPVAHHHHTLPQTQLPQKTLPMTRTNRKAPQQF